MKKMNFNLKQWRTSEFSRPNSAIIEGNDFGEDRNFRCEKVDEPAESGSDDSVQRNSISRRKRGQTEARHRNKIIPYKPILRKRARDLRNNSTFGEILLWMEIKNRSLGVQFHRQVPMDKFIVDFYCHELMLAIEIDGSSHDSEKAIAYDAHRQARLESFGVRFLRFRDEEVRNDIRSVIHGIEAWLEDHGDDWVGVETPP
jgi:very-short-patch-repair endonuclease